MQNNIGNTLMTDARLLQLQTWLEKIATKDSVSITKLAGDASFRRYFRITIADKTFIAMDAPPEKENCRPFIAIAKAFAKEGVQTPQVFHADLDLGFLLLSDFGDDLLFNKLTPNNVDHLYNQALEIIPRIQYCKEIPDLELTYFCDKPIVTELSYFTEWFLQKHLKLNISHKLSSSLQQAFNEIIDVSRKQPQYCIHRDFHSRNLLTLTNQQIGVLDFQDAVWGPITYDAVSLLRDCYIAWPQKNIEIWTENFYELVKNPHLKNISFAHFRYWFDFVGIQRHLKVLGIFARLCHRDGKSSYLADMPRILNYIISVSENYPSLTRLRTFLKEVIAPALLEKQYS